MARSTRNRDRFRGLSAGVGALLLGACGTLEPAYHRPPPPVPATFPADAAPAPTPLTADIAWKTFFLDPRLAAIIELGLAENRDLRVAVADVEAARAKYRVQRAQLFPTIDATAAASVGQSPAAVSGVPGGGELSEHVYAVELGVSAYELDLFGRIRSLSKSALEQYLATDEARRATRISLVAQIAGDWLAVAADEAILQEARATLASGLASLEVTQKRFAGGIASQIDVSQAQSLVEQVRADVAADITAVARDRDALELVAGAPVSSALLPEAMDGRLMVLADLPVGLPSDVLLARPDVLEAEHQLESQNAQIGAARAAFFPAITLTASGGTESTSLAGLFAAGSGVWNFTPQVSLPLFTGGANRANLAYARAQRTAAVAQYEKAIQRAFAEVADALARRATIGEQLGADEAAVTAAGDSLRLAQLRYDRGADTYLNVLIAQRTLYAAEQSLTAARLVRSTNLVSLYQALGGGLR